jgi:hypothetical protein
VVCIVFQSAAGMAASDGAGAKAESDLWRYLHGVDSDSNHWTPDQVLADEAEDILPVHNVHESGADIDRDSARHIRGRWVPPRKNPHPEAKYKYEIMRMSILVGPGPPLPGCSFMDSYR